MFRPARLSLNRNSFAASNNATIVTDCRSQNDFQELRKSQGTSVLSEFCSKSTIHGIAYFANDQKRHWLERIWWIIAIVLSVVLCINSIHNVWLKWNSVPIIITLNNKPMPLGDIPFPAITICPITKTAANKFNYTDVYRSMLKLDGNKSRAVTKKELEQMKVASELCDEKMRRNLAHLFVENFTDWKVSSVIRDILPVFKDTIVQCNLFGKWKNCNQLFYPLLTEEGLCYTFNMLNVDEMITDEMCPGFQESASNLPLSTWDMESGYDSIKDTESYPYRVYGTGTHDSFTVIMRVFNDDIDHLCGGAIQGFKAAFHPPNEGPQMWKNHFIISPGRTALVTIEPKVTETSSSVAKYSPDMRLCYFTSERQLRFYKRYTQRNCEVECLSNWTLAECGCVKFSMPRARGTRICGPAKMKCMCSAHKKLFRGEDFDKCNCLPACTTIAYNAYISQSDYDIAGTYTKSVFQPYYKFENSTFSRLTVSFKEETFVPSKRSEFQNLVDFLANSGGLFGLFMGASLLSIIELLYYLTVRVYFAYRRNYKMNAINRSLVLPLVHQNDTVQKRGRQSQTVFTGN